MEIVLRMLFQFIQLSEIKFIKLAAFRPLRTFNTRSVVALHFPES